ncbi:MAG: Unknown protein [uncultured Campylobacterales bacterium]|uniref:Uncharacterized protein n=1 Tax=uncultured Campylobacterales bacterium TaxID=352960 RepID=A0A6S6SWZ9_9BACT|nr:MAG: Unknown protein [uncultured Campylobacterales bacterium]
MKPILRKISKAWLSKKAPSFYRSLYKKIDFNTRIIVKFRGPTLNFH